ncbi:MAG: hypothetical protein L0H63_14615 [Nitrococcus sp.]|nr:hypothetical protein [Nitrococcus sp.]
MPFVLVNCCGLRGAEREADEVGLGIELAPDYWGRYGYAVEVGGARERRGGIGRSPRKARCLPASRLTRKPTTPGFVQRCKKPWMIRVLHAAQTWPPDRDSS